MEYPPSKPVRLPAAIKALVSIVECTFPEARCVVEKGGIKGGNWWIDFTRDPIHVTVEWHRSRGFAIYDQSENGYGDRPQEVLKEPVHAARRIIQRLEARTEIGVRELREIRGISQVELADRLGIQQTSVSKFERRTGVKIQTLAEVIKCMGGVLKIQASFPDGELPILFNSNTLIVPNAINRTNPSV